MEDYPEGGTGEDLINTFVKGQSQKTQGWPQDSGLGN